MTDSQTSKQPTFDPGQRMHSKLPPGEPGWRFIKDLQKLHFTPQDLAEMETAMEEFSQIDLDEWQ
jgi:hypothetical protein